MFYPPNMVEPNYYPQYAESSKGTGKGEEEYLCEDWEAQVFAKDTPSHQGKEEGAEYPPEPCVLRELGALAEIAEEELFELSHDNNSGFS